MYKNIALCNAIAPGFDQLKDITIEEMAPHTESTTTKRNLYRASAHITDIAKENPWKTLWIDQSYEGIIQSISEPQESRRPIIAFYTLCMPM